MPSKSLNKVKRRTKKPKYSHSKDDERGNSIIQSFCKAVVGQVPSAESHLSPSLTVIN